MLYMSVNQNWCILDNIKRSIEFRLFVKGFVGLIFDAQNYFKMSVLKSPKVCAGSWRSAMGQVVFNRLYYLTFYFRNPEFVVASLK